MAGCAAALEFELFHASLLAAQATTPTARAHGGLVAQGSHATAIRDMLPTDAVDASTGVGRFSSLSDKERGL